MAVAKKLIEIAEARRLVLDRAPVLESERVAIGAALGRVLAEEVVAPEAVPGFDNSAMDGFAVRAADTREAGGRPVSLRVVGESRAGHPATATLAKGEAIAISTGAMVPEGADAVVRVEDTSPGDGTVEVRAVVEPGGNVRRAGEDIAIGETVLAPGALLGPAELGVVVSTARAEVRCARRPRVSVVVSGDELIGPSEPMRPGAVRDSNAYTVPALAQSAGAELAAVEHAPDDGAATRAGVEAALESDVAVVTGGISVGRHDHVRPALAERGVEEVFWGVALRPGKPTWFGTTASGTLAFGLPGNPVSAMVTFVLFVRPALLAMQGRDPAARRASAVLEEAYAKNPGRAHAIRCRLRAGERGLLARPTKEQGSHVLTSMLGADGLAIAPTDSDDLEAGERVTVELLPGPTMGA